MKKTTQKPGVTAIRNNVLQRIAGVLSVVVMAVIMTIGTVYASPPWMSQLQGFLQGALWLIGGALAVIGLVMFGLGQSQDDASRKSTGIMMLAGGIIIAAAGALVPTLFTFTTG